MSRARTRTHLGDDNDGQFSGEETLRVEWELLWVNSQRRQAFESQQAGYQTTPQRSLSQILLFPSPVKISCLLLLLSVHSPHNTFIRLRMSS